jgi:hypothetical protein
LLKDDGNGLPDKKYNGVIQEIPGVAASIFIGTGVPFSSIMVMLLIDLPQWLPISPIWVTVYWGVRLT